mmetsp:Transcript_39785/g.93218  ORF Transcript_39785/g.93218 Transcript_39785/m.93218 type:complete len:210 (+) Transcript_39785:573-1202(+)
MQSGFAMLCAGSVRQKNVKNIMLKNLLDACGGALGFYLLGFGFAYGKGSTFLGGAGGSMLCLSNIEEHGESYANFFFQFAFAATAATIVAGTVAERCKMEAYLCYSLFLTSFVYPGESKILITNLATVMLLTNIILFPFLQLLHARVGLVKVFFRVIMQSKTLLVLGLFTWLEDSLHLLQPLFSDQEMVVFMMKITILLLNLLNFLPVL